MSVTDRLYIATAVYDGVPGAPDDAKGTEVRLKESDGLFYAGEIGAASTEEEAADNFYKIALGAWYQTTDFEDYSGIGHVDNHGVYGVIDKMVFHSDTTNRTLGVFFQGGYAEQDRNQIGEYFGAGVNVTGLVEGRDNDIVAVGIAHARNTDRFMQQNEGVDRAETALEAVYRAQVTAAVALQPDLQYIIHPSMDPSLHDALVLGLRLEVGL